MNLGLPKSKDRGAPTTRSKALRGSPVAPSAIDEVADTLGGEVARCAARATEHAMVLESIGVQSFDITRDIFRNARSPELLLLSHRIRGLVVHALSVLAELQCIAGRLDALAALRAADPALEPKDDDG
jgi:hypothetical protein